MKKRLTFLGTGGSLGIPVVGCSCAVCRSSSPFNQRLRPSVLIQVAQKKFLIDVGPDFRQQALRYDIQTLEGVLLTHAHYDHTAGIDDLRSIHFRRTSPLPILLSKATAQELHTRYYYLFPSEQHPDVASRMQFHLLPDQAGEVLFEGLPIQYVTYSQGGMDVNGYRLGDLAYLSDIRHFSPAIVEHLKGLKILIISALRYTPSPLHFSVDEALDFAAQIQAKQVWLTHLSHDLDHEQTNAYLPSNVRLAYDGLEIEFE
jgi:phosphoribosyl 1,2-cyclic phosphate phosphodiesterase